MELCTTRHILLSLLILQLVAVSLRQVFDFLGFMWASVLVNFLFTLFIIFGIFGVIQLKSKHILAYILSSCYWFFWNMLIVFIYFNIFGLSIYKNVLSFRVNNLGWWETNGPGCKITPIFSNTATAEDPYEPITSDQVKECAIDYKFVEGSQAAFHVILVVLGIIFALKVNIPLWNSNKDDESIVHEKNKNLPLYSVQCNRRAMNLTDEDDISSDGTLDDSDGRSTMINGSRPMTPRRVKRRSVNAKYTGTLPHYLHKEEPNLPPPYIHRQVHGVPRSSVRRLRHNNPVSRYLDQQNHFSTPHRQMLNDSSTSNDSFQLRTTSSSRSQLLSASELLHQAHLQSGQTNANFISNTSLDRPPSARSSYSNYHGVRTLAYNNGNNNNNNIATPQFPSNTIRRPVKSNNYSTFLSDGPPAYDIQGAVDSETVI